MPFLLKRKRFSEISIAFSQSAQNFVHFENEDQLHGLNISEIISSEKCCYFNAQKSVF